MRRKQARQVGSAVKKPRRRTKTRPKQSAKGVPKPKPTYPDFIAGPGSGSGVSKPVPKLRKPAPKLAVKPKPRRRIKRKPVVRKPTRRRTR